MATNRSSRRTHIGFQKVPEEEKERMVASVFHNVAKHFWKHSFVNTLHPVGPLKCLDVAGGTGDIAFRITKQLTKTPQGTQGCGITVCDINSSMLKVVEEPATKVLPQGNSEHLSFDDNSFDVYTIVFGILNVTHVDRAIQEAYRVLKPGGRFMCMKFSQEPNPLIRQLYDAVRKEKELGELVLFYLIPFLGEKVASDRSSYQYLVESIRRFPPQEKFKANLECAGFKCVTYTNFTFGVTSMHSTFKL
ncbi:hypothetical protein PsorP6_017692 [Peronosclerospora sorghi]|uniref:Uncharacterized protein n=1 Tax=Peronosclerospora sorghi TaxID=230839 RepID=A0ACC0WNY4_9STRA|nr:hypothetical protein PsorP6_017692 [Peronosclerospora sorghi]